MDRQAFRDRVKTSPVARVAALPLRARLAGRYNARLLRSTTVWLVRSREHENFTYDLTPTNREHLAWFVALAAGASVSEIRGYLAEIEQDDDLRRHVEGRTRTSDQRGLADRTVRYGRRIGWYALVRAVRPSHVVETGTDKGLGSCVIAAALLRNGRGTLTTLDVDPDAGYLLAPPYSDPTELVRGDSVAALRALERPVDMFIHDSDHSAAHEAAELVAVEPHLTERSWVLSDNAHVTPELARWAERAGRRFLFFDERPSDHWYPGAGIGLALPLDALPLDALQPPP
jgi:hypothetical protein